MRPSGVGDRPRGGLPDRAWRPGFDGIRQFSRLPRKLPQPRTARKIVLIGISGKLHAKVISRIKIKSVFRAIHSEIIVGMHCENISLPEILHQYIR
jgi:hypothetical protein